MPGPHAGQKKRIEKRMERGQIDCYDHDRPVLTSRALDCIFRVPMHVTCEYERRKINLAVGR